MRPLYFLPLVLSAGPAFADTATLDFKLEPAEPSAKLCRSAVETGKILRSDETGTYIFTDYHLVRLIVEADRLSCTAMFVTNP